MKNQRLKMIIELVNCENITTQEQLCRRLRAEGFAVTQATVSRDIKELALVKQPMKGGGSKYAVPALSRIGIADKTVGSELFLNSVTDVDHGLNTVVLKCRSGMAQAICARLDSVELNNAVGTLAGDDTVFVLMRTEKDAERFENELRLLLGQLRQ